MMREKHVLVSRDGKKGNVLKIKPPIVFNKENVDELIKAFGEVLPLITKWFNLFVFSFKFASTIETTFYMQE